jgi:hypothetical protein
MTFPFIVGSLRTPVGAIEGAELSHKELRMLLKSMLDETPEEYVLRISRCDHIDQPIVAPTPAMYRPQGIAIHSPAQARDTLFVDSEFLPGGDASLVTLTEKIWTECQRPICDGRFSFRRGEYHPYDKDDLDTIQQSQNLEPSQRGDR